MAHLVAALTHRVARRLLHEFVRCGPKLQ
jgi:hypothetical protein